jgi:DNA-binding transcriptional ArsR family regulator
MNDPEHNTHWQRYGLQAEVIQGLAHPIRLAIVDLLRSGEVCVCDIAAAVDAGRSNVSRHLAVMLKAGIVRTRKEGLKVYYSLRTRCVLDFMDCATRTLAHDLEERTRALAGA